MKDSGVTVEQLKIIFKKFCMQRGWNRLTSPKDLSMDIVSEASELMDLFIFVEDSDLPKKIQTERAAIQNEVADIAFALLNFCTTFDIDLSEAIEHKLALTARKYPPTVEENEPI